MKTNYAVHPSESIKELQEYLGLTHLEFANALNIGSLDLSQLLNKDKVIDQDLASQLAKLSDTPPSFWLNLQSNYDKHSCSLTPNSPFNEQ